MTRKMYHRRNIIWMSACVKVAASGELRTLRTPPISLNNFSQQKLSTDPGGRTWGTFNKSKHSYQHYNNIFSVLGLSDVLVVSTESK